MKSFLNFIHENNNKNSEEIVNLKETIKTYNFLINSQLSVNDNSIGFKNYINIYSKNYEELEVLMTYLIEKEIFEENLKFVEYGFVNKKLYFFHPIKSYSEKITKHFYQKLEKNINKFFNSLSINNSVINYFVENHPHLLNIAINKNFKNIEKLTKPINFSLDIDLINEKSTKKSVENFYDYFNVKQKENIKPFREEIKNEPIKKTLLSQIEQINDRLPQLFWKTFDNEPIVKEDIVNEIKENVFNKKNSFKHSIIFMILIIFILYPLPKIFSKIKDLTKSNLVIDDILDIATEDLTMTKTMTKTNLVKPKKKENKLNTILEESRDTADQFDDIEKLTQTILDEYTGKNKSNLKNIEERLIKVLEETSSNN